MSSLRHVLSGVTVPVLTPMRPNGRPDAALAAPLLEALAGAGIEAIMLLGSNGEGAMLERPEAVAFARDVASEWRRIRGAGARVTATAFGSGTAQTVATAEALATAELDAVVVPPPHYFVHTPRELVAHFRAAGGIGVPIVAYNIPKYTSNPITPDVLREIAELQYIVGVKDSSGIEELVRTGIGLQAEDARFGTSQGNERRLAWAMLEGAVGVTPGLANVAPAACVRLAGYAVAGQRPEAEVEQQLITALTVIHSVRPGVAATKAAARLLGLAPATASAPIEAYSDPELAALYEILTPFREELAGRLADPRGATT